MARVILNLVVTYGEEKRTERTFSLTDMDAEKYYRPNTVMKEKVRLALKRKGQEVLKCANC